MVEYRLRPEHAEEIQKIKTASGRAVQEALAKVTVEAQDKLRPIFGFYGINPQAKGYVEEREGDFYICLPEATAASTI